MEFIKYKTVGILEHFFREKAGGGQSAKCKICSTILKATGGSTKGLHEHLKRIHGTNAMERKKILMIHNHSRSAATELFSAPTNAVIKKFVYQMYNHLEESEKEATEASTSSSSATADDDADNAVTNLADSNTTQSHTLEQQLELAVKQYSRW